MTAEQHVHVSNVPAADMFIRITVLAAIAVTCFMIVRPFLPILAWGIIIAIAVYPWYSRLVVIVRGKHRFSAALFCLALFIALILPFSLIAETLAEGVHSLVVHLQDGTLTIPPPPSSVATWPIVGAPLSDFWNLASTNLGDALSRFAPQLKALIPVLLAASAGLGSAVLQFLLAILLAGFLLATGPTNAKIVRLVFDRLFLEKGPEFQELTEATIRSVTNGIIGVAIIQTICAGLGFILVGLPGAGLWTMLFLVAAVLQVGVVVLIPAVAFAFTITSTTGITLFVGWCIVVALMDNVLKPLLLGRGGKVPIAVIFLGVIGGFMAMGLIGLFVGAIILSVGYKLLLAWLSGAELEPSA
jgi:predicted PurR-regulated permease PerM